MDFRLGLPQPLPLLPTGCMLAGDVVGWLYLCCSQDAAGSAALLSAACYRSVSSPARPAARLLPAAQGGGHAAQEAAGAAQVGSYILLGGRHCYSCLWINAPSMAILSCAPVCDLYRATLYHSHRHISEYIIYCILRDCTCLDHGKGD